MSASILASVFAQAQQQVQQIPWQQPPEDDISALMWIVILIAIFFGVLLFFWFIPVRLWIAALASGAHVGLFTLVAMRLRRVPPKSIVEPRISAVKAGLTIQLNLLEGHYLAGGNVQAVVNAPQFSTTLPRESLGVSRESVETCSI